jgi:molecular chaperone GrpE
MEKWLTGVRAVYSAWENVLYSVGLEKIPTAGTFDPVLHEAVGQMEKEGAVSGDILATHQTGWKLNGKVIRPAKVIISK